MHTPYPFPFGNTPRCNFKYAAVSFFTVLTSKHLADPKVIAELDLTFASLHAMASDPDYARSAIGLEAGIANGLKPHVSKGEAIEIEVLRFILERYRLLDYPVSARSHQTLELIESTYPADAARAQLDKGITIACQLLRETPEHLDQHSRRDWEQRVDAPMFSLTPAVAIYLIDPELLGVHRLELERFFALRTMEVSARWKRLVSDASRLLTTRSIPFTPYMTRIQATLSRQDWIRPREVALATSMINSKFNYIEVIEQWTDKLGLLDLLGQNLLSYHNSKPWLEPYCTLVALLCHMSEPQGDHPTLLNLLNMMMLPEYVQREETHDGARRLSTVISKNASECAQKLQDLQAARSLDIGSKAYYEIMSRNGLEGPAVSYLKRKHSKDPAHLLRVLQGLGLDQRRHLSSKTVDAALGSDLGL